MNKKFSETISFTKIDDTTLQIHAEQIEGIAIVLMMLTINMNIVDSHFPDGNIDDIMDYLD